MIKNKLYNFFNLLKIFFNKYYFGYFTFHNYLNKKNILFLKNLLNKPNSDINRSYEIKFANKIGNGYAISFASARMAFYFLMLELNIKKGDEVLIQAANCSVMINAILKTGAKPIFVDIDVNTLGTSTSSIRDRLTTNTKLIVVQHSFGIPSDIENIKNIAHEKKIFLLEDCALSFDSKFNNITLGNFGDAAIFSTDYSKPINTIIGGILYTKNLRLYEILYKKSQNLEDLSFIHQLNIYKQILEHRYNFSPEKYGKWIFKNYFKSFIKKLFFYKEKVKKLDDDYSLPSKSLNKYPYPAKLPSFLAQLGLFELEMWERNKHNRKLIFDEYKNFFLIHNMSHLLPSSYFDFRCEIIPLRFIFYHPHADLIRKILSDIIHVDTIWFLTPIVATKDYRIFNYIEGFCPNVENTCKNIINLPVNYDTKYNKILMRKLNQIL